VFLGDTALSNTKSATLVLNSTSNSINFDPDITVRSGSSGLLKITRNGAGANFSSIRGGIALNNNVTLDGGSVAGQGLTVSTIAISGTGNVTTDNAVRFTVANTYNGTTTINSGTLSAGVADALPDTALAVNSGATFDMSLTNATFNQRVAGLSDGTGGGGTIVGNSINTANSGNIQNRTLTLDGTGGTYAFSGIIMDKPLANTTANSNLALAKSGNSSQALSGVNTYTGSTTVSGGTLLINGAGSINGTSGVAVNGGIFNYASSTGLSANVTVAGGNFKYNSSSNYTGSLTFTSGTLGGTNLNGVNLTGANAIGSGKVLSPGNSPGTLQVDDVAFGNGGAYLWEINDLSLAQGGTAGTKGGNPGWDWIDGTGNALDLTGLGANGFTLQIDSLNALNGWNANGSYSWVIATFGSINGFNAGNFVLDSSAFGDQNSLNGSFSLGVSGNDLVLSYAAVPEPSTYTLFALGLGALLALRRKQRRS
jgi:autotransporter-associated beta strand protein